VLEVLAAVILFWLFGGLIPVAVRGVWLMTKALVILGLTFIVVLMAADLIGLF
jgi:hypothetical protein